MEKTLLASNFSGINYAIGNKHLTGKGLRRITTCFLLSGLIFGITFGGYAQAPSISYSSPKTFNRNVAITPLAPTNTGGAVPANIFSSVTTFAGTGTAGTDNNSTPLLSTFNRPYMMAFNTAGDLYVTCTGDNTVRKIAANGTVSTFASGLNNPTGITIDGSGNVYVSETNSFCITKFTPAGVSSLFAGTRGSAGTNDGLPNTGRFRDLQGLAYDGSGSIYVADCYAQTIRKVDINTGSISTLAGQVNQTGTTNGPAASALFAYPTDVSLDATRNILYVADQANNEIRAINLTTNMVSLLAGNPTPGHDDGTGAAASFSTALVIETDAAGNVFVADNNSHRLRMITPAGVVTTIAGSDASASTDGIGTAAAFKNPYGLAFNSTGDLFVADGTSNNIRIAEVYGYSVNPALPAGLSFNGTISGTPTATSPATDYAIGAVNAYGSSSTTVNIAVTSLPSISYNNALQTYAVGMPITPVTPTSTNIDAPGYGSPVTIATGVSFPSSLAIDAAGNVFTANNKTVYKIAPSGGGAVAFRTTITDQNTVALDASGNMYIGNVADSKLSIIPANGDPEITITNNLKAKSIALDSAGNVYMTCPNSLRVIKIAAGSRAVSPYLINLPASPDWITADPAGNLYVLLNNGRIYKIPVTGAPAYIGPTFTYLAGIAIDASGNIYVGAGNASDGTNSTVTRLSPADNYTSQQVLISGLNKIYGVAVDAAGTVYYGTNGSQLIQKITPTGGYHAKPLPTGLTLNETTGVISGTPTDAGSRANAYTVTAYNANGTTTSIVNLKVNSSNADIAYAGIADGTAVFDSGSQTYTAPVAGSITSTLITLCAVDPSASITLNGVALTNNSVSSGTLSSGNNVATIVVTSSDNSTSKTYTLNIYRQAAPTISYTGTPQTYAVGSAIAPVTPTSRNVDAPSGYTSPVTIATGINFPSSLAIDAAGNVYTADNKTVYKISPTGGGAVAFRTTIADQNIVALDAAGNMYVGNGVDSKLYIIPANGGAVITVNTNYNAKSIAVDSAGNVYMTCPNYAMVLKIAAGTHAVSQYATGLPSGPDGIASDPAGNLYVTLNSGRIYKIPVIGTPGYVGPTFAYLEGIAIDASGNIYAGAGNSGGTNTTVTKLSPADNYASKQVLVSGLNQIVGVAVDAAGTVYYGTHLDNPPVIQKISPVGGYHSNPLPTGLTLNETTGVISGTPETLGSLANTYTVTAYNAFGTDTSTVTLKVNSNNADINYIGITDGITTFDSGSQSYTVQVPGSVTSTNVIPYPADPSAVITVNGVALTNGSASTGTLLTGSNTVTVVSTSSDNSTTKTYTLVINRLGPPAISYTTPQNYTTGNAITPLTPTSRMVDAPAGYSSPVTVATGPSQGLYGTTVDAAGNVYYTTGNSLYKLPADGSPAVVVSSDPGLASAEGVGIDAAGNIYVSIGDNTLKMIPKGSTVPVTIAQTSDVIRLIKADAAGNVYLSSYAGKIIKIAAGSHTQTSFSVPGSANDVTVDAAGNIYVSILNSGTSTSGIYKIPVTGTPEYLSTAFTYTRGLTIDASGNIYVSETPGAVNSPTGVIRKINASDGSITTIATGLTTPISLSVDGKGNVYSADLITGLLQKFSPVGGYHSNILPAGLVLDETTGAISGTPVNGNPAADFTVTAYNAYGNGSANLNIGVSSNNASLNFANLANGSLSPAFDPGVFSYTQTVSYPTASTTVTPYSNDLSSVITINDAALTSGLPFTLDNLNVGDNDFPVKVTSSDGSVTNTYNIKVTRTAPNVNTDLSNLTVNTGTLSPSFTSDATVYTMSVSNSTTSVQVTPTIADATATMTVNNNQLASGSGVIIPVNEGSNAVYIIVTAQDGTTTKTYSININRAYPPLPAISYASGSYLTNSIVTINPTVTGSVAAPAYSAKADTVSTSLSTPSAIATDAAGNVYVSDVGTGKIFKYINGTGTPVQLTGSYNTPLGLATDTAGNLYVTALGGSSIKKYTAGSGGITGTTVATTAYASGTFTNSLAVDAAGNIYFSRSSNAKVYKVAAGTSTAVQIGDSFGNPYGIAVDASGNVYVADAGAGIVKKIAPGSNTSTQFGPTLSGPLSVAIDASGYVFVADGIDNKIYRLNADGSNSTAIASNLTGAFGVASDASGSVYITDNGGPAILKVKPAGGFYISPALPAGLTLNAATGVISGTPAVTTPAKNYTITGYNTGGGTAAITNIKVISNDASLASLGLSSGTLSPAFAYSVTGYTATASNATTSVTVTPVATDAGSVITVNGDIVASATASAALPLNVGNNTITILVSASDGTTTNTYTVNVERLAPAVPALSYAAQALPVNVAITPLAPTSTNVFATRYSLNRTAFNAFFQTPWDMAADAAGNLYLTENQSIREIFASDGHVQTINSLTISPNAIAVNNAGSIIYLAASTTVYTVAPGSSTPQSIGDFTHVSGLAVDAAGNVYVADYGLEGAATGAVKKISGGSTVSIGSGFVHPQAVAVDSSGNVYVADAGNNTISKIAGDNTVTVLATGIAATGLSADVSGNVFIASQSDKTIYMIPAGSTGAVTIASGLYDPSRLASDAMGNVYINNMNTGIVEKMTPVGGYFLNKPLPAGLSFNNATGVISGTPVSGQAAQDYNVTAYNNAGSTTAPANIKITTNDATLSNITLSEGSLNPAFAANTTGYTAVVDKNTTSITITPTVNTSGATVTVNSTVVTSGSASADQPLNLYGNTIPVVVTSSDGSVTKTYTLTVYRDLPSPTLSYTGSPYSYLTGTAITPLTPVSTFVEPIAYNNITAFSSHYSSSSAFITTSNKQGDIFMIDTLSGSLYKILAGGGTRSLISSITLNATGLAAAPSGVIYSSDGTNVFSWLNGPNTVIASGFNPRGLAVDTAGNLYIADKANNNVKKMAAGGGSPVNVGSGFSHPQEIATDIAGNVYVGDLGSQSIKEIFASDGHTETIATGMSASAIRVDKWGNVFVAVSGDMIKMIPAGGGTPITVASGFTAAGIVVGNDNALYVDDRTHTIIQKLTQSGGYSITNTLPAGLNFNIQTGVISGTPTAASPATDYTINGYNHNTGTAATINITSLSTNTNLSNLVLSDVTLSPGFATDSINYTSTVPYTVASVKVTPTASDIAVIKVNNNVVTSGSASDDVPLNVGSNTISVLVTAQNAATKTYTVNITRLPQPLPTLGYDSPKLYVQNTVITPLTPVQTNVDAPAYNPVRDTIGSGFVLPSHPSIDAAGNIYLADGGSSTFKKIFKSDNHVETVADGSKVANGIAIAYNTAIDGAGNVYISYLNSSGQGEVSEIFATDNHIETLATNLDQPRAITVDYAGNLYVAEYGNGSVKRINTGSRTVDVLGGFTSPQGLAIDSLHNLYVADITGGGALNKISLNNNNSLTTNVNGLRLTGLTIDGGGNMFATTGLLNNYVIPAGTTTPVSLLNDILAYGMAADGQGNLYIGDYTHNTFIKVKPKGGYYANALPAGLILDMTTGVISGMPTVVSSAKDYTVTAYNTATSVQANVNIQVAANQAMLSNLAISAGTLTPAFVKSVNSYTDAVTSSDLYVTLTPTVETNSATVTVNGADVISGTASAGIRLNVGDNAIPVVVKSQDGSQTQTYTVTVNRPAGSNPAISNLILNKARISPTFNEVTTDYTASVSNTVSTINLSVYYPDPTEQVTVNGSVIQSGSPSADIPLNPGDNTITTIATAEDGTFRTYTIVVTRQPKSTNNALANLITSPMPLDQTFDSGTFDYTAHAGILESSIDIKPVAADSTATITVDGSPVLSGSTKSIALNTNFATYYIRVTSEFGNERRYSVSVIKGDIPPAISYNSSQVYSLEQSITPLVPISRNVTPAFSAPVTAGQTFIFPKGVSQDAAGNIYVYDVYGNTINKIFASDQHTQVLNHASGTNGLTVDAAGNVYFSDASANTIKEIFAGDGHIETIVSSGLNGPAGLTIDVAGNIYEADYINGTVNKIAAGTRAITQLASGLTWPNGVAIDAAGNVYVSCYPDNSIKKISVTDNSISTIQTTYYPAGLAIDTANNIYYTANNGLFKIPAGGGPEEWINSTLNATSIFIDASNNAYVTDIRFDGTNNSGNVYKFTYIPGYSINPALPAGLTLNSTTGVISGTPTVVSPATDYTVTAYNSTGNTTATVNIKVAGNNALLSNLTLSTGNLDTAFTSNTFNYNATVSANTSSVKLIPTTVDPNATVTLTYPSVSGAPISQSVPLSIGYTSAIVHVTSSDGSTSKNYIVNINRPTSSNDSLASLAISQGTLSPVFDKGITSYTATVANTVTSVDVTPVAANTGALVSVRGTVINPSTPSVNVPLNVGDNNIIISVTAPDNTSQSYTIVITRQRANANLTALTVSQGTLSPAFDAGTTSYAVSVANAVTSITVTPTLSDTTAGVTVNGDAVASGSASSGISLNEGANNITVAVTRSTDRE